MKLINTILAVIAIIFSIQSFSQTYDGMASLDPTVADNLPLEADHYKFNPPNDQTYEPSYSTSVVMDAGGNTYTSITLGDQVWLNENLNTAYYNNGDPIADGTHKGNISNTKQPALWFDYNDNIEQGFGKLYTWYAAMDVRGVCPDQYHVATLEDWSELIEYMGGPMHAGEALKIKDNNSWNYVNFEIPDHGFDALPARMRPVGESFCILEPCAFWWINDASMTTESMSLHINASSTMIDSKTESKKSGLSIRCVRDK